MRTAGVGVGGRVFQLVSRVAAPGSSASPALALVSGADGVDVSTGGPTLRFARGRVEAPPTSTVAPLGRWISQPDGAPPPTWVR